MSETPSNPTNPADSAAPASPATAAPQKNSNWLGLGVAVAAVTLGGFALGRISGGDSSSAPPADGPRLMHVPMNVATPSSRISPAVLERVRQGNRLRLPPPGMVPPPAALQAAPGSEPASPHLAEDLSKLAVGNLQSQVDACFASAHPAHPGQLLVAASVHRSGEQGAVLQQPRVARSNLDSPEAEKCVLEAVGKASLPTVRIGGDVPVVLPFGYGGAK